MKRAGDAYKSGMTDPITAPSASAPAVAPAAFDPHALPPLRDVIARFGLEARKSLGQWKIEGLAFQEDDTQRRIELVPDTHGADVESTT